MAIATVTAEKMVTRNGTRVISKDEFFAELDAAERRIQMGKFQTEQEMWAHERSLRARLLEK